MATESTRYHLFSRIVLSELLMVGFVVFKDDDSGIIGKESVKVAPFPFADVTVIVPPCASIMRLQMAKPKPIPCALVVTNGEKSLGKRSSGIPVPVSAIEIFKLPDASTLSIL